MNKLLHVLNGDFAERALLESGLLPDGEPLVWREMYSEGPLADRWWETEAADRRAAWFDAELGITRDLFAGYTRTQFDRLRQNVADGMSVVLWLDPDLFDQTIGAAVARWLVESGDSAPVLLCPLGFGGPNAEAMRAAWTARRELTAADIRWGASAWTAYAADEPGLGKLRDWLKREAADASGQRWPELSAALRFHLQGLPDEAGGRGIVERLALETLAAREGGSGVREAGSGGGGMTPVELFAAVSRQVPLLGLTDLQFWRVLERLAGGPSPAVALDRPSASGRLPRYDTPHPFDWAGWLVRLA